METFEYLRKYTDTPTTGRKLKPVSSEPFLSRSTNTVRNEEACSTSVMASPRLQSQTLTYKTLCQSVKESPTIRTSGTHYYTPRARAWQRAKPAFGNRYRENIFFFQFSQLVHYND